MLNPLMNLYMITMKTLQMISVTIIAALMMITGRSQEITNDFYDDAETYQLSGKTMIQISGELANPGIIDISALPMRSLIIKETLYDNGSSRFVGAYRYDGYSLYDILNTFIIEKANLDEFPPVIDMYVTLENEAGESVVLSWGELYYPVHRHEIIIATQVARIVPSKTKDLWPLPEKVKLVVGHDLLTERNISNPVKITVHSAGKSFLVNRDLTPLFSPMVTIYNNDSRTGEISRTDDTWHRMTYETIFYGRGRGIHKTTPFHGVMLKEILGPYFAVTPEWLRNAYFIVTSVDGYRCVFTFSEVFNRNDQSEVMLVEDWENQNGGAFRLFPAADFFSDRAVKAVSEIHLLNSNFSPR